MSPTTLTPLIQVQALSYTNKQRTLLHDIHLTLLPNQIVSLIGPNGAGKTTLVKLVVGLLSPTAGTITRMPGLSIGYMPQRIHISPIFPLTVGRFLQLNQTWSQDELQEILNVVGVNHVYDSPLDAISGGELQRVLLARALLRKPQLLVLDEPAQGVDLVGQGELYDLLAKIRDERHCAILLVSHDLNVVMARTNTVVCLNQHVCCSGLPEEVSRDPAFAQLFGKAAQGLAFYTHHHDHHHDLYGKVVEPCKGTKDD